MILIKEPAPQKTTFEEKCTYILMEVRKKPLQATPYLPYYFTTYVRHMHRAFFD